MNKMAGAPNWDSSRAKRKRKGPEQPRKSFKWTEGLKMSVADYIRTNYDKYLKSSSRITFLRTMRTDLCIARCDDKQVKNGFDCLIKKYKEVKEKLNSSGTDPDQDTCLDKGWALKQCPYFELLDEVMGTTQLPNAASGSSAPQCESDNSTEVGEAIPTNRGHTHESVVVVDDDDDDDDDDVNAEPKTLESAELKQYVEMLLSGLGVKGKKEDGSGPKATLKALADIAATKTRSYKDVAMQKLDFENRKFDRLLAIQKLQVEKNAEIEAEKRRTEKEMQEKELRDKRAQREFEIAKIDLEQKFQLKKMELQIELEKVRSQK